MGEPYNQIPDQAQLQTTSPLKSPLELQSVLAAAEKPAGSTKIGETTNVQYTTPGTLAFLLKDLKAQQAIERLEQIAVELGYDPATGAVKTLADTEGHIVATFMELKELLASLQGSLDSYSAEAEALLASIEDAPVDYTYPRIPSAEDLATRADEIKEELGQVQDDLEDVLNRHASAAQLGHFQPMMLDIKKAYQTKEGLVGIYRGQVTTLGNSITDYRQVLVEKSPINEIHEALNPLRRAKKLPPWPDLGAKDVDAESAPTLKTAAELVEGLAKERETEAAELLAETGVSFARWKAIFEAIGEESDPGLSADEERSLLEKGVLRKKLVVCS